MSTGGTCPSLKGASWSRSLWHDSGYSAFMLLFTCRLRRSQPRGAGDCRHCGAGVAGQPPRRGIQAAPLAAACSKAASTTRAAGAGAAAAAAATTGGPARAAACFWRQPRAAAARRQPGVSNRSPEGRSRHSSSSRRSSGGGAARPAAAAAVPVQVLCQQRALRQGRQLPLCARAHGRAAEAMGGRHVSAGGIAPACVCACAGASAGSLRGASSVVTLRFKQDASHASPATDVMV